MPRDQRVTPAPISKSHDVDPAIGLCLIAAACARTPTEPPFTLEHLGSNVWAAIDNPNATASQAASNGGFHLDHVAGNRVFAEAGATVLAQQNVRDWIHTENLNLFGRDIPAERRIQIEGLSPPSLVYEGGVDLYLGARHIQVRSLPGHSGGDSVVLIPDARTAFVGDLLWRNSSPTLVDASTQPWIDTLNTLMAEAPGFTFVPGHGDVGDDHDVRGFQEYLVTLRRLVADGQAQRKSGEALVEAVLPVLTAKYGMWDGAYFKDAATRNILETEAELKGEKRIPRPVPQK